MKSPVVKRSLVIADHKTSVSLEDAFWKGLKDIANAEGVEFSDEGLTKAKLMKAIRAKREAGEQE